MRKFLALLALLAVAATLALTASPAQAASRVVHVQTVGVPSSWPVASAMTWVDKHTGSVMKRAKCVQGRKCITLRHKTIRSNWAAVTYGAQATYSPKTRVTIYLNPMRSGYSWEAKRRIIIHELAHALGVTWHSAYCTNVMYPKLKCPNGRYPALRFTDPARARLRIN